jgi:23S rRNA pseudouridine1911/1915/1917 synthase
MDGRLTVGVSADESGMKVQTVLRRSKGLSTRLMRRIAQGDGALLVNGAHARFVDKVKEGDEIVIVVPRERSDFPPEDIPLDVIYEDEHLLVMNKAPGIVVHPTKGHASGTIANAIQHRMESRGEEYRVRFISRLDMNTSGVLLAGKSSLAQSDFAISAAAGKVTKEYTAIAEGHMDAHGVIDEPIALEAEGSPRRTVREDGRASKTEYVCEKTFEVGGEKYSLLRVFLHTGRTHQIRVHLAHIGHPVLADSLYGRLSELIERQALHASKLSFPHPITGQQLSFEAELREDMRRLISP